jgi:hypothetical protein
VWSADRAPAGEGFFIGSGPTIGRGGGRRRHLPSSSDARNACSDLGPNPATSLADAVGTTVEDGEVIRLGHALDAFHVVGADLEYEGVALSQLPH